ncbi:hypothetical protein F5Y16DRAFT_419649 [Xylariaceae sp. FL0255]|nr:hypothetical protein F5Y16DRAFT_419649 [Xylariaceae sp. FL0255]
MAAESKSFSTDGVLKVAMGHIHGDLREEKAYELFVALDESVSQSNMYFKQIPDIPILDARSFGAANFSLESCGFEFVTHDFQDGLGVDTMKSVDVDKHLEEYLKSLEGFLMERMKAKMVILYDWRIRSTTSRLGAIRPADRHIELPPAQMIHADESARGGLEVVLEHITEDEQLLLKAGKASVWRPLVPVVHERPLALCEWESVEPTDWVLCDQVHEDRVDEAMYLRPTASHRWWYLPEQRNDELSLFVVWDSKKFAQGIQASTPHGAFDIPGSLKVHERKSLEVRTIIITEE